MEEKDKPKFFSHFLRSCTQESDQPIDGQTTGSIPAWLKGCLVRVGSGKLFVGPDHYNHLFDGLALLHRFGIQDGQVTYQSKFLKSDTYRQNMEAQRITVEEFGTSPAPDPCKTIFQRFFSLFSMEMTDNDLVNLVTYSGEVYACSETNFIWRINEKDLESIQKVNLSNHVPVVTAIAHAHEDTDGTVYNIGNSYGYNSSYVIFKFPPRENADSSPFEKGSVICRIPSAKSLTISYHHSFAMTDNYFVFIEQPVYLSFLRMWWAHFVAGKMLDALYCDENIPCRFHVVRRSDGCLLDTVYHSEFFMVFHHINAYEEDGQLVVDLCCYENADIIQGLYVKALQALVDGECTNLQAYNTQARRYVLPIDMADRSEVNDGNLVTLPYTKATSFRKEDGSIMCYAEVLTGTEIWHPELPRINYVRFNGKKYRYFYAIARKSERMDTGLIKVDTKEKTVASWYEKDTIPSEPVFIARPDADMKEEDAGVILASLLYLLEERKVSLLVLDAKTMKEICRTTFITESSVPGDFHGKFVPQT